MGFIKGNKVYHRGRKESGVFVEYDKYDLSTAIVYFPSFGGDYARVSHSLLSKEESTDATNR